MFKTSLQYIKNNQLTPIEQPYNSIVKVEPVVLGNYTFNNSAYPSIDDTTTVIDNDIFKDNTLIGNLVGENDKIENFEITVAIKSPQFISNNPNTNIILSKRVMDLSLTYSPFDSPLTCTCVINEAYVNEVSVDTTGLTYLECCMNIIDAINEQIFHKTILKYKAITMDTGAIILKIVSIGGDELTLHFNDPRLSYENGYIYYNEQNSEYDVMTVPLDVNNTNNVINYSTLNDGTLLYIRLSNPSEGVCNVVQTTTVI